MLRIKPDRFSHLDIIKVTRNTRKGHIQISAVHTILTRPARQTTVISAMLRSRYMLQTVRKILINTVSNIRLELSYLKDNVKTCQPLIIRINYPADRDTINFNKQARKRWEDQLLFITRAIASALNRNLKRNEKPYRVYWYSAGVSRHRPERYGLIALRQLDPMLEVLLAK